MSVSTPPLRCHCGLSGVRDYGRFYAWVLEFWSMGSRVLDARARPRLHPSCGASCMKPRVLDVRARNRPLRVWNRGLWIPDTSTTPDSVQRSSGRPRARSRKPRSDARAKFPPSQASSKPPDFLRKAAENAREAPAFVHRPPFRANSKQNRYPPPIKRATAKRNEGNASLFLFARNFPAGVFVFSRMAWSQKFPVANIPQT